MKLTYATASNAEAAALREQRLDAIAELLAAGPKSAMELSTATGINRSTMGTLLLHMDKTLRTARRSGDRKGSQVLWELGENPEVDDELDQAIAPKRPVVPARDIGMGRDYLVHAFFGWQGVPGAQAC
jgi:hypothetical protein